MAYNKKKKKEKTSKESKESAEGQAAVEQWRSRMKKYEKYASEFLDNGKEAWSEFLSNTPDEIRDSVKFGDRAYAHVSRFVQSSYYSRVPKVIGSGDFDRGDEDGSLAAFLAERLSKRFVQANWFGESIEGARDDYVNTARGVTRVYVESEWVDVPVRKEVEERPLPPDDSLPPEVDPETGEMIEYTVEMGFFIKEKSVDPKLVKQDEKGFYIEETMSEIKTACPYLGHVSYKDYFHTPTARTREMLTWEAYRLKMDKETIKERWPDSYEKIIDCRDNAEEEERSNKDYFEIFECWDKSEKEVYYLFLEGEGVLIEELEDPFNLSGFFPSVGPIVSNKLTDRLWGINDYTSYKDKLSYLKALDKRRKYLATLLRRNGIGDGKHREILQALNEHQREGDILFIDQYQDLANDSAQTGSSVKFFPVEQYVQAFDECNQAYANTKQEYYEYFGLERLLQAQVAGQDASSENAMVGSLGLLYTARHRKFQEFIQENVRRLVDLAVQILPEKVFKQLVGYEFLSPERKERFGKAYAILESDFNRAVRVDIDLDSTIATSQEMEAQANMQLFQTVTQSLGPLTDIAQTKPEFMAPLAGIVMAAISKMKGGNGISDELAASFKMLQQQALTPPEAPGPSVAEQQVEIKKMLADHKIGLEQREQQFKEYIETEKQKLNEFVASVSAEEKMTEERRLAEKQQINMGPKIAKAQEATAKAAMMTGLVDGQALLGG